MFRSFIKNECFWKPEAKRPCPSGRRVGFQGKSLEVNSETATFSRRFPENIIVALKLLFLFLLVILLTHQARATTLFSGTFEAVKYENKPHFIDMFFVRIENNTGGKISISEDKGISWREFGTVVSPTEKIADSSYTASKWVKDGEIAAVAVNAIHIKTDTNTGSGQGVIFSIIPKELESVPEYNNSFVSPNSSIYTDIKAGEDIFGGKYSPFVGNEVNIETGKSPVPIQKGYVPKLGDVLIIRVARPKLYPKEIDFENRFGGRIVVKYLGGGEKVIGMVLKPVLGVGRFIGSQYAAVGRIRANHPGVICISTSPLGKIGGFQIIPAAHGMSKEMILARTMTQWMVVGPPNAEDPSPEGVAPLYQYFIRPVYSEKDIDSDNWEKDLVSRFLVEVKYKDKDEWESMPTYFLDPDLKKPLPAWSARALENVTDFRILFPLYEQEK